MPQLRPKMPPRSDTVRRCAFKLPKNDKYQCQKVGDKHQPHVRLYYCRLHDRHAQDRCQALIEWAGKGAQCEQLGVLVEKSGKRLCDWHKTKSKEDDRLQRQSVPLKERKVVTTIHEPEEQLPQAAPAKESPVQNDTPQDDTHLDLTTLELEQPVGVATIGNGLFTTESFTMNELADESFTSVQTPPAGNHEVHVTTPPSEEIFNLTIKKSSTQPYDMVRTPHIHSPDADELAILALQIDEIPAESLTLSNLTEEESTTSTPITTMHAAYEQVIYSLTSSGISLTSPPPRRPLHVRVDSMDSFLAQDVMSPIRSAAMYVQCCVCLEKHSQDQMRQVEPCMHQYRDLCLRKILKTGGARRYNCRGCREWMEGMQREC